MATIQCCLRRAALLALAVLLAPASAYAGLGACPEQPTAQVFLPWADPAWYAAVPDGGLEAGGTGWTLGPGATIAAGNEPYYVHSATDARSLALGPSASAASPATCLGPGHPTLRFFARSQPGTQIALTITAEFVDPAGVSRSIPIGVIAPTPAWRPSPVLPVVLNTLALALAMPQAAAFRFTAGDGGWSVDDVYVDPYGKG
jgi:hypothetical protein